MSDYRYKESRIFISKEEILMRVTQEEIFKMILGYLPREHRYVHSPFRKDRIPDCYFEWYKNSMWFIDWAEPIRKRQHRDCFNMVQDHFGISFYKSLEVINAHFKLNLLAGHHDDSDYVVEKRKQILEIKEKKKDIHAMPFKARVFNAQGDREFWSPYQITRSDLIEDDVFPIIWYKIFSRKLQDYVVIRPQTRSYLVGNFDERRKFYTPDKQGKGKWATNCISNDIWGINDLPLKGKRLIITKSYKDWRVLKNQGIKNVIAFQNEGMYPKEEILRALLDRFEEVIIFFDNDRAGILAAEKLVDHINVMYPRKARCIYLKESLQRESISDPSDLIKIKGKEPLTSFLNEVKLIN
jgi:5S rRNA maturation endonuclease (ribonuclease M5)